MEVRGREAPNAAPTQSTSDLSRFSLFSRIIGQFYLVSHRFAVVLHRISGRPDIRPFFISGPAGYPARKQIG